MENDEQVAFDLGWDFATFGASVPDEANKAFCDGYRAFASGGNRTTRRPDRFVRKWLQIRHNALRRGKLFSQQVTPEYIEKITPDDNRCPVTAALLTFGTGERTDWSVDRANNKRGYVRGNIIIISQHANYAKGDKSLAEIWQLACETSSSDGLSSAEWRNLAQLIEPAFGDHDDTVSPVAMLFGQPVALGMPVSPIAGFQIALSRALIEGWDRDRRELMLTYVEEMHNRVCKTKLQRRAFNKLAGEIMRRSWHIQHYAEIWATSRVQKRLWHFINTLGGSGLGRLAALQEITVGEQNTKIA